VDKRNYCAVRIYAIGVSSSCGIKTFRSFLKIQTTAKKRTNGEDGREDGRTE